MPVIVKGAAWSAIRIDKKHIRVILMDQGYINPQDRTAKITFQGKTPKEVKDLFSGERINLSGASSEVTVPAGSIRFVEVTY